MSRKSRVLFFLPSVRAYLDRAHVLRETSRRVDRLVLVVGRKDAEFTQEGYPNFQLVDAGYRRGSLFYNLLRAYRLGSRLVREQEIEIVHDTFGNLSGLLLTKRRFPTVRVYCSSIYTLNRWRLKHVFGDRSHLQLLRHRPTARLYYNAAIERFLARSTDSLVFQTRPLAERFGKDVPIRADRIAVIPNSVDVGFWSSDSHDRRASSPEEPVRLLYLGPLEIARGVMVLLETMRELMNRGVPARMTIAGRGALFDEREILDTHVRYGLEGSVRILDSLSREEVRRAFLDHDALIYQTRNDASPRIVLEAMATGIPIVASHHPGIDPLDEEGEALNLTDFGDVDRIVEMVEHLHRTPERFWEQADRGREIVDRNHSSEVVARRYADFYESMLGRGRTREES